MNLTLKRPLVVFDLETTGIDVCNDRIIELSAKKIYPDGKIVDHYFLLYPGISIPKTSSEIHGFYDKDVKDQPTFEQVKKELYSIFQDSDLAGYNSNRFDIPLLVEEFHRNGVEFDVFDRNCIDVQNIFHKMEQRTLKAAYKFYCDKPLTNAHSAEADTNATYEILLSQLEKYKQTVYEDKKGVESIPVINDMNKLASFTKLHDTVDLIGRIIYNENGVEVFNFGKYKGKPVLEVFEKDPGYYGWMKKGAFPINTKRALDEIKKKALINKFS